MAEPAERINKDTIQEAWWEIGAIGALDWFSPADVPVPVQLSWEMATHAKEILEHHLEEIARILKEIS